MATAPEQSDLMTLLAQDGVQLRRSGSDRYWARCPFHQERKPSFQVRLSPAGYWTFRCWSQACGVSGGARTYRRLTNRQPAEQPEQPHTRQQRQGPAYDPLTIALLTVAANHYNEQLPQHPEAIRYLTQRGVDPEMAAQWGVGYAPGNTLYRLLAKQMPDTQLERCALLRHSRREDRLSRRIIIPNFRRDGTSDWHTGRAIDPDNTRPYLSVLGSRPALLRLRDPIRTTVVLVEGPFDLLAVLSAGQHGAATAGNPHPTQLRRAIRQEDYRQALLLPDRDAAGQKWAEIVARACPERQTRVRILELPDYCQDPADAMTHRTPGVRATIATAIRRAYTGRAPPGQVLAPKNHNTTTNPEKE